MFTNKELNTFIGLFYAASRSSSPNPDSYNREFRDALNDYFLIHPNMEYDESSWTDGDDPEGETAEL